MSTVLLHWVGGIPWKMQSILLSGLRAPDAPTNVTKRVCRWMRAVSQNNADPSKGYMAPQPFATEDLQAARAFAIVCIRELEYLPCHYVHYFCGALRVISLYHPDPRVRCFADLLSELIATEIFHFYPETNQEFIMRHQDKVAHE